MHEAQRARLIIHRWIKDRLDSVESGDYFTVLSYPNTCQPNLMSILDENDASVWSSVVIDRSVVRFGRSAEQPNRFKFMKRIYIFFWKYRRSIQPKVTINLSKFLLTVRSGKSHVSNSSLFMLVVACRQFCILQCEPKCPEKIIFGIISRPVQQTISMSLATLAMRKYLVDPWIQASNWRQWIGIWKKWR